MKHWVLYVSLLTAHVFDGTICQSIVLTPTQATVDINETLTFTCTYIGYGEVIGTRWNIESTYTPNIVRHQDDTCSGGGIFDNSTIYRVGCPSDTSFSVTILRVKRNDHNVQWECLDRVRKSNTVTIFVQVPVVNVSLHLVGPSSSFIKEHSRQTIKCKTSPGRPQPNASWFLYEANNNVKHKITINSSIQIISSGAGLVSVESTLQFYPNRSINEWVLNCEAWTNNETRTLQSKGLTLNIVYPPDRPPVISGFENGEKYPLIESEIGKLSCTTHGGNPLAILTWKCYNNKPESTTIEDKNVSSTVTWSGLRDQSSCTCVSNHSWSGTTQTTTIQIDVLYSPNKPTLTISNTDVSNSINVILNNTVHVKCESKSKPHPTYSWIGPADMQTIQILNVTINDTKDRKYECIATNRMVRQNGTYVDGRNESGVTIKVLYPPGKPYFKYEYSNGTKVSSQNMIDVIAGDSFTVHCRATGNPQPTNKWDSNEGNDILKITSITYDRNKTCHAMYTLEETVGERRTGSTSGSFFIRVLYPPHIPIFTISNGRRQVNVTTATIQLKETDNINMTCFSDGKPVPKYTWTSHNAQIHENIRQFANIMRKDAGKYTCNVSNVMKRSFGDTENGLNVSSISLDILYPSTISLLEDGISILEGSDLNETCRVQKGNPTTESVSWTRISDNKSLKNSQLIITNVSRADDTNYTCTLRSTIIPTIGDETLIIRSKTIHLNVFFSSEIKHFTVVKNKSSGTFIVNQRDEVSLECTAEANPASILSIYNTRDTMISTVKNRNVLLYSINNASYENAGKYKCEGRNNYTKDKPSVSELTMIVKCSPRPSLAIVFPNKIAAAQFTNKTLNFVAYEYLDEENKTQFMWLHKNISIDRNDEKFEIISIGLNSSLSVKNITQMDFGEYSVKVSNTIGEYIHHYMLQAEEKPDVPINLTYKSGSITKTSVTLVWTPGFDGGFPQTFILLYQYNQEKWHNVQVQDTNEQAMDYTLTGLLSSKVYNIKMFSMNKKGNSSYTQNLQITTKINVKTADSQSSDNVGIIGGSISGVAVVMIVSILLAAFFLKRRNIRSSQRESPKQGVVPGSHVSSTYTDLDASRREINNYDDFNVTYEHLNASTRAQNTYMELKNTNVPNADTSDYVNIRI